VANRDVQAFEASEMENQAQAAVRAMFRTIRERAAGWEAHQAEEFALDAVRELGRLALREYFNEKGDGNVGLALGDEEGNHYRRDSRRTRLYFSVFGKIDVTRLSYRAEGVAEAIYPLDALANLPDRRYSFPLQERIALAAQSGAFKEEMAKLDQLTGTRISDSVAQVVAREVGRHYDAYYESKVPPKAASELDVLVVGFDGKGVPLLASEIAKAAKAAKGRSKKGAVAGKKMATVGVCYDVAMKDREAEAVARDLVYPEERQQRRVLRSDGHPIPSDSPKAYNVRRIASIARPREAVFDAIEHEALARDPHGERPLAVLMDGERALEKEAKRRFRAWPVKFMILDLLHVLGYLWSAANAFYGEGDENHPARQAFVFERLLKILDGRAGYVAGGLQSSATKRGLKGKARRAVDECVTYFRNHLHMMRYEEYLHWGLPIATGLVESACGSVVQHRMEGQGKRWTLAGAESILRLRSLRGSHDDWSAYFAAYPSHERARNHGATLAILNHAA